MAVEVVVKERTTPTDIFTRGNLVVYNGKIVYVAGPSETSDHFRGICLAGNSAGAESSGWIRDLFKQFVGTVTLEGKL